jgi:uncharacterized repeat protein (TIGR03806 family)
VAYPYPSMASLLSAADPRARAAALFVALALSACSSDKSAGRTPSTGEAGVPRGDGATDAGSGVTPAPEGSPYETLAEWHLFAVAKTQIPNDGIVPYEVISQLFADYAYKRRFMYVPKGKRIGYSPTDTWGLPVGTILVKTFSYLTDGKDPKGGERLLETRLLIHESSGWAPHTYVWNEAQTGAALMRGGATIDSQVVTTAGNHITDSYIVPSEDDCRTCHGRLGHTDTLGGRTRQLDRDNDYGSGPENQIDHLAKLGLFDAAPEPTANRVHLVDPFGSAPISDRARSYLDGNCSHCHQQGSSAGSASGFWVDYPSTDPNVVQNAHWGRCKQPTSASGSTCGLRFDIVPGKPDESIIVCRMESTAARARMPPIGRNLVHAEGVALLREWISGMPSGCGAGSPSDSGAPDGRVPEAGRNDASGGDAGPTDGGPG